MFVQVKRLAKACFNLIQQYTPQVYILLSIGFSIYYSDFASRGYTYSLPAKNVLIGRNTEVNSIILYLTDSAYNVNVVTLWGLPGLGKTEIAFHVGHSMLEMGFTVHYIRVQDFSHPDNITEELFKISKSSSTNLRDWVTNLRSESLLILDNVDGVFWVDKASRIRFQEDFVDILNKYSSPLKMLVTSQQDLYIQERWKSYLLSSLTPKSCLDLTDSLKPQAPTNFTPSKSESICDSVGYNPLAVKVVVRSMQTEKFTTKSGDKSRILRDLAKIANLSSRDKILSALELSFEYVHPDCQKVSLLLHKFVLPFTKDDVGNLVTPSMMKESVDFDLGICLQELVFKSFLERMVLPQNNVQFTFHVLVIGYLNDSLDKYTMKDVLHAFWENYFTVPKGSRFNFFLDNIFNLGKRMNISEILANTITEMTYTMKGVNAYDRDLEIFNDILRQNDNYSFNLAIFLLAYNILGHEFLFFDWKYPTSVTDNTELYDKLVLSAINFLLSDCKVDGLTYQTVHVERVLLAYSNIYSQHLIDDIPSSMDAIMMCERKLDYYYYIYTLEKGKGEGEYIEAEYDYGLFSRILYLHNYMVDAACVKSYNRHVLCRHRWQRHLALVRDALLSKSFWLAGFFTGSIKKTNVEIDFSYAMALYVMRHNDAVFLLQGVIQKHKGELLANLAYTALYDVYLNSNDMKKSDEALRNIIKIFSTLSKADMERDCYSSAYGYVIIPFLHSLNEHSLKLQFCIKWLKGYISSELSSCDRLNFGISREEIVILSSCIP